MFKGGKQQKAFEQLKERIETIQREAVAPSVQVAPSTNLDELEKLGALKEKGYITEAEFEEKKRQLLDL